MTAAGLAGWVAAERPLLGVHQFCLAGLPELIGVEVLYALQQRDQSPPPMDPTQVRILLARLTGIGSLRDADPQTVCESGGTVYNSATTGLFRDLRHHLERAWVLHTGTDPTAELVLTWQARRSQLLTPPATAQWLFPSPLLRAQQSHGHVTPACVCRAFKAWTKQIGTINGDLLGPDGRPTPFDTSLVTPYALRHSYAQRHADAGVPVDVLRELMDHVAVATTMGYYRISLKRKQQAIRSVGSLATDANGNPAPFTSPTAYQRASVAVPFGNCTEPSNVTAGGGACPIRFQCAGCGFYRPDPSYLPALEQHVADLRADRETARAIGAADYVLANLTAEIDAFARVAEQMQHRLADLASDERAEVEQASRLLRRARAGRRLPLTVNPPPAQTG
jgi:hypothetical protein